MKIATFVPVTHLETVQQAVWNAGAGTIGEYTHCSFFAPGKGTFLGSAEAHPAVGKTGQFEQVDEYRLEVLCPAEHLTGVIHELRKAHPYEEPGFDVYPLHSVPAGAGAGRCGDLPAPLTLAELAALVRKRLRVGPLQFVGTPERPVKRLAIACGSAAEFLGDAQAHHCDALLTGEARFHDCLHARDTGVALLLAGHYASERPGVEKLCDLLRAEFPGLTVWASESESDPIQWDCD
jgi:hypothetical protein